MLSHKVNLLHKVIGDFIRVTGGFQTLLTGDSSHSVTQTLDRILPVHKGNSAKLTHVEAVAVAYAEPTSTRKGSSTELRTMGKEYAGGTVRIENVVVSSRLRLRDLTEAGHSSAVRGGLANPSQGHRIQGPSIMSFATARAQSPTVKNPARCRAGSVAPRLQGDRPKAQSVGHATFNPSIVKQSRHDGVYSMHVRFSVLFLGIGGRSVLFVVVFRLGITLLCCMFAIGDDE